MIIPIVVVAAFVISLQAIVVISCLDEDGNPGLFTCEIVIVDFIPQDLPLEKKIDFVVDEAEEDLDKVGQNYVRLAIDSDLFSHEEKLQVIEKFVKEENTPIPFTENVITGKNLFEDQEPITFTWKQYGWGTPCPDVAIQDELQVDQYNRKVVYQEEKQSLCPVFLEDSALLFTFTEVDFANFPPCGITGKHIISVRNQFDDWFALHEYWCFSVPDGLTPENIDERLEITKQFFDNFEFDQATILQTEINYASKQVVVTIDSGEFTEEHTAEYHKENLKNWIPFDTRILIASGFAQLN